MPTTYKQFYQTKALNKNVQVCSTISVFRNEFSSFSIITADTSFNLPIIAGWLFDVISLVFDAVGVAVFIVYHFVLSCRPGTQNNLLFLNAKPNSNLTKHFLCTSNGFGCGKIVGFRQYSNSNSVTS